MIKPCTIRLIKKYGTIALDNRTNPVSLLKDAMNMIGYNAGVSRLPLTPGTEEEKAKVRQVMEKLDII